MTNLDAKKEYEQHRKQILKTDGIGLPTWDELDEYDKSEWEKWVNPERKDNEASSI